MKRLKFKKMDDNIKDLPVIEKGVCNKVLLAEYFSYYEMETMKETIDLFNR